MHGGDIKTMGLCSVGVCTAEGAATASGWKERGRAGAKTVGYLYRALAGCRVLQQAASSVGRKQGNGIYEEERG